MRVALLGPPGSGKGTQAALLAEAWGVPHIATGDLLRRAVVDGTALGAEAKGFMDAGELVPDDLVVAMMEERLREDDCERGYVLDGFPRTVKQAELLDEFARLDAVVLLSISEEAIPARFAGRRVCPRCEAVYHVTGNPPAIEGVCDACGESLQTREDDQEETVLNRLRVYEEQTIRLLGLYRDSGRLVEVDASIGIDETQRSIGRALSFKDPRKKHI